MNRLHLFAAFAALALPVSASAQDRVSAQDPAAMAQAMKYAGFPAELSKDDTGDPMIKAEFDDYSGAVYFYDCSGAHDKCGSVQFNVGLDRKKPMTPAAAMGLAAKYRFAAIHLDDEGDPYIAWDVLTGEGMPRELFVEALRRYSATLDDIADEVFAEERAK
jgi:hypothetical protein